MVASTGSGLCRNFSSFLCHSRCQGVSQLLDRLIRILRWQPTQSERNPRVGRASSAIAAEADRDHVSWHALVDALPDPALVLDQAGTVIYHNPLVADLYPRVRIGSAITLLSREPDLLTAIDQACRSADRTVVHLHDRVPVTRRMSAIVSRIGEAEPETGSPSILVVLRDLTDQEKHAQIRSEFIAYASHELRTPLASLKLIVETLQGPARKDPEKRERFLSMMLVQASRMAQLIDDLLSLSRIEMRAHLPPRDIVEMSALLESVLQALEPLAESNDIKLELINRVGAIQVRGDRDELAQVFHNLVQNAIRYGRPGGFVRMTVDREQPAGAANAIVRIAVCDNGIGIAPEHLPRLTERFYRVSAVDSRAKGGTGLGLAIVKHIITRHRGDLDITSTPDEGSTFTVTLDESLDATDAERAAAEHDMASAK